MRLALMQKVVEMSWPLQSICDDMIEDVLAQNFEVSTLVMLHVPIIRPNSSVQLLDMGTSAEKPESVGSFPFLWFQTVTPLRASSSLSALTVTQNAFTENLRQKCSSMIIFLSVPPCPSSGRMSGRRSLLSIAHSAARKRKL